MTVFCKLAVAAALVLVPLGVAQAGNLPLLQEMTEVTPGGAGLLDPDGFRALEIDGARDQARVEPEQRSDDNEQPGLQTRQFEMQVALSCRISGSDLIIVNTGRDAIAAGATIKWKGHGQKGYLAMKSDVPPGKGFVARDLLHGVESSERCSARGV